MTERQQEHRSKTQEHRSKIAIFCGLASVCALFSLFLVTEYLTDASIMLLRVRIALCSIVIIPFIAYNIKNRLLSTILSVGTLIAVIVLSVSMYIDRNQVIKLYIENNTLSEDQQSAIKYYMKKPKVLLIAAKDNNIELPEQVAEYSDLDENTTKALNDRFNPHKPPDTESPEDVIKAGNIGSVRYSGIQERLIFILPNEMINKNNYGSNGFIKLEK